MFDRFYEKVNEPFRSDIGHNTNILIWLWIVYVSLFLVLLMRDFFSVRRRIMLGKDLDDGERQDLPRSVNLNWLFIASGAFLNLYQIQYIMFHNSSWWTAFCCLLFLVELSLVYFDIRRSKRLASFVQNKIYCSTGSRWAQATAALTMVLLPIFGAFMAQAQYYYDRQFIGG